MRALPYTLLLTLWFGIGLAAERQKPPNTGLVGYKEYLGLLGEEFAGNVFIFRHNGHLLAAMSRHQFENGIVPSQAEDPDGAPVLLDRAKAHNQQDVQILPLKDPAARVQFMDFSADYALKAGERLWISRGTDMGLSAGTYGSLRDRNLMAGSFSSTNTPVKLILDLESPADVRGGSGLPVIQVATGKPVGVLLEANDGKAASYIVFEPICLPIIGRASAELKPRPASEGIPIDIHGGTVFLKGHPITRETRVSDYEGLLGKPDRVTHLKTTIYTYDDLGILLYQRPGENTVLSITLALATSDFEFYPKRAFHGALKIAGQALGPDTPQTALRNLREARVKIDSATERMKLPFSMLTHGDVVLSFTYISSPKQLDSLGISWETQGEPNDATNGNHPIGSETNRTSSAPGSRR
jgi:hypothetical protein